MAIKHWNEERLFELRTNAASYVFGVNDRGTVQHLYWGEPVEAAECSFLLKVQHHSSFDAASIGRRRSSAVGEEAIMRSQG